ncbi:NAD(P)-dependent alcohol dehydrogenase [Arthrobacter sp. Marseille-P9274]|uniref:NAD(P)-dependent alcohol dehydrogenase n=1 Tax=Arthrobacter sp. Marseille-P9274 TaxID=2866572 RepID=UPI0021C90344|nr:NAD(P)-dependent alcohol dehydrogenase [Arthrobacter sp. Marseille-P9274]
MKAIVQDAYGESEVLRVEDVGRPEPGDNEVLVQVRAAGVDAGVWHLMAGRPYLLRLFGFGLRGPKLRVRGRDVAGVVAEVGRNVTRFRPGDEVFGTSLTGTYAEFTSTSEDRLELKPVNLGFSVAAAVPVSGCAALHGLRDAGQLRPGQAVLIIGAGGGVGTFAVQLAKAWGAEVTGVCSASKAELVRSLGADRVIDYAREDFADGTGRYDLILDIAGNSALRRLGRALAPGGTLVIAGGEGGGRILGGVDRQLRALLLSPFSRRKLRILMSAEGRQDLKDLKDLIESGKLAPAVDRVYPLGEVSAAIGRLRAGQVQGKVVIAVG